jgi:hypothetical protein
MTVPSHQNDDEHVVAVSCFVVLFAVNSKILSDNLTSRKYTLEVGYNVMKGTEYFVSL